MIASKCLASSSPVQNFSDKDRRQFIAQQSPNHRITKHKGDQAGKFQGTCLYSALSNRGKRHELCIQNRHDWLLHCAEEIQKLAHRDLTEPPQEAHMSSQHAKETCFFFLNRIGWWDAPDSIHISYHINLYIHDINLSYIVLLYFIIPYHGLIDFFAIQKAGLGIHQHIFLSRLWYPVRIVSYIINAS